MFINPYDTTFGTLLNIEKLDKIFNTFLIDTDDKILNYEYENGENVNLVFITGKNLAEVDLPIWHHPYLFKDFKGNLHLFVNMRPFVKIQDADFINLHSVIRDHPGFEYTMARTIFTLFVSDDRSNMLVKVQDSLATGFSSWLTGLISGTLSLDTEERLHLNIVLLHYFNCIISEAGYDKDSIQPILFRISKLGLSSLKNLKYINATVDGLNHAPKTVNDLVDNIKIGVASPKTDHLTTNTIFNLILSSWYGPNAHEALIMAFEHPPTWLALMYVSIDNRSYKKTRLASSLNDNKKLIKTDPFLKYVSNTIKEQIID